MTKADPDALVGITNKELGELLVEVYRRGKAQGHREAKDDFREISDG